MTVKKFAELIDKPVTAVITELLRNGIVTNLNESIDFETAAIISEDLGVKVERGSEKIRRDRVNKADPRATPRTPNRKRR